MNRQKIALINGPFGAGKTTVARYIASKDSNYQVCDWDEATINDSPQLEKAERTKTRLNNLLKLTLLKIKSNYSVIIPNTITEYDIIDKIEMLAETHGVQFVHIVIELDEDTCKERVESRSKKGSITDKTTLNTNKLLKALYAKETTVHIDLNDRVEDVYRKLSEYLRI